MFQLSVRVAAQALALVPMLAAAGGAQGSADGELGADDFRISSMGPDGDPAFVAAHASLAYGNDRFLVVWEGSDTIAGEVEIYGQLLDNQGAAIGDDFRISSMGPDGDPAFTAAHPSVTHASERFLVVWEGSDTIAGELEIHGQFLDTQGNSIGTGFLISSMGPDGDPAYDARTPDVVLGAGEFLVVWAGADTTPDEFEIYAQRVSEVMPVGVDDYRVSFMGVDGDASIDALEPAVANFVGTGDVDYAVVWHGDATQDEEFEIYYQQLSIEFGHIGQPQPQISETGPPLDPEHGATCADIVHLRDGTSLVVWQADEGVAGELEIHGQRVDLAGLEIGPDDFRISTTGVDGDPTVDATQPALSDWATQAPGFLAPGGLVAWMADVTPGEKEIVVQALDPAAVAWGPPGLRISSMGPDGSPDYGASSPAIATPNSYDHIVAWHGDDDAAGLAQGEQEIYGQLYTTGCTNPGAQAIRSAGTNPSTVIAMGHPAVAMDFFVFLLPPPGTSTTLFAFQAKTSIVLSGGQVLLCFDGSGEELLTGFGLPVPGSGVLDARIPIPPDLGLCGFEFSLQALHVAGAASFVLSNAYDLTIGR